MTSTGQGLTQDTSRADTQDEKSTPTVLFGAEYPREVIDFDTLARHGMINPEDIALCTALTRWTMPTTGSCRSVPKMRGGSRADVVGSVENWGQNGLE